MTLLRIAMIGQRGIPATYGGVEHHVEELGSRLAAFGHDVTVYCRTNYCQERALEHRGMRLRHLPTVGTKHLDTIVHSFLSTLDAVARRYDVIHYHALGPGLMAPLARMMTTARIVQTVHGMDNERAKWNRVGRNVLGLGAWTSARVPHETITVSRALADHYATIYGRRATAVPNGVAPGHGVAAHRIRDRWGLSAGGYVLFVGRLVPEKQPDVLLRAFAGVSGDLRLVIAGDSSHTDGYARTLREMAARDPRVVMPGYVYGDELAELYGNAAAFVLPSSLEGLPLTLLEAISFGCPVVASDIPPHREVLLRDGPGHRLVPAGDERALREALLATLEAPAAAVAAAAGLRETIMARYDWDAVAADTCAVYGRALGRPIAGMRTPPTEMAPLTGAPGGSPALSPAYPDLTRAAAMSTRGE